MNLIRRVCVILIFVNVALVIYFFTNVVEISKILPQNEESKSTAKSKIPELIEDKVPKSIAPDQISNFILHDEVRESILEDEVPKVIKKDEVPKVIKNDAVPKVIKKDEIPKVIKKDEVTKVIKKDAVSKVIKNNAAPKVIKNDAVPKVIKNDAVPKIIKNDKVPKVIKNDKFSKVIAIEVVPKVIKNDKFSKVIANEVVPNELIPKATAKELVSKITTNNAVPQTSSGSCAPKTNIMFVKPHKTGTSSLQNILFRFAIKNHLLLAMPHAFEMVFFKKFDRNMLYPLKPGYEYNIFAHHSIFDYDEMRAVMPDDTTFVTILRDPVSQFESTYSFFKFEEFFGMNLTEFALLNASEPEVAKLQNKRKNFRFGRNQQAFDLGVDPVLFDDEAAILKKVEELDRQIDLAIITSLMDQSLILLKDELCWSDYEDIVSIKRNSRTSEKKVELSEEVRERIRRINRADQLIYDHFYNKFARRLEAFGTERMERELERLESAQKKVERKCLQNASGSDVDVTLKPEVKNDETCANLLKFGRSFSISIFDKHKRFYKVKDAEVTRLYSMAKQVKKMKNTPTSRHKLKDLGFPDRGQQNDE